MACATAYGAAFHFKKDDDGTGCRKECKYHEWTQDKVDDWVKHDIVSVARGKQLLKNTGNQHIVQLIGKCHQLDHPRTYTNRPSGWLSNMKPADTTNLFARFLM